MLPFTITLEGDSLGKRHQHLNKLVNDAFKNNISLDSIQIDNKQATVERIFKIDLASKLRNVDFILETLFDLDMLYVSRALKSTWLFKDAEYSFIINPQYLEESLYPKMTKTAVSKMKNKVYLNLKDENRCKQFYEYYKNINLNYALKFLPKCKKECILAEIEGISQELNPYLLKLLCEKTPEVIEVYYKSIITRKGGRYRYLGGDEESYLNATKNIAKKNVGAFIYILENFFVDNERLNAKLTKYIVRQHKEKVFEKIELYASRILNLDILAKHLTTEENQEVVLRLARAEYLDFWFSYKNVEPFLKRIPESVGKVFVKKVFVDKEIGERLKEPAYSFPSNPEIKCDSDFSNYKDLDLNVHEMEDRLICVDDICEMNCERVGFSFIRKEQTLLDRLFNAYRFDSFPKTFYELKKKLVMETSNSNRMMIMNVLVSKTGGKEDQVRTLLEFLSQRHSNEPSNVRASVVRSLVRRSHIYRLSNNCWELLSAFARGIDIEDCVEFLHADIIRHSILQTMCSDTLTKDFLDNFSTLSEFDLTVAERQMCHQYILDILILKLKDIKENDNDVTDILWHVVNLSEEMKLNLEDRKDVIDIIKYLTEKDVESTRSIIGYLYDEKKCRQIFFKELFFIKQNEESYVNVLKHDVRFLYDNQHLFRNLVLSRELELDNFFKKVSIYFKDNLSKQYVTILEEQANAKQSSEDIQQLAKGICILKDDLDFAKIKEMESQSGCQDLTKIFCQNLHHVRPQIDRKSIDWKDFDKISARNLLSSLNSQSIKHFIKQICPIKQHKKLALDFSFKLLSSQELIDLLTNITQDNYIVVLKVVSTHIRSRGNELDPLVWKKVKEIMENFDFKREKRLLFSFTNINNVPLNIKVDYCVVLLSIIHKINLKSDNFLQCVCNILNYVYDNLTLFERDFIDRLMEQFMEMDLKDTRHCYSLCATWYIKILSKYLLVSITNEEQHEKFEKYGKRFLMSIADMYTDLSHNQSLNTFLRHLKNTKVFLDATFVSPMPLYENILAVLKEFMSVEKNFNVYVQIHLTMLFYKTVQQCLLQWPDIRSDFESTLGKAIEKIGIVFGRYIAKELEMLLTKYFLSVIWIYRDCFLGYINTYFGRGLPDRKFHQSLIKGLLEDRSNKMASVFAVVLYKDLFPNGHKDLEKAFEFINDLDNSEIKFFFKFCINNQVIRVE